MTSPPTQAKIECERMCMRWRGNEKRVSIKSNHTQLATNHRHTVHANIKLAANRFALHTIAYIKHVAPRTKEQDKEKHAHSLAYMKCNVAQHIDVSLHSRRSNAGFGECVKNIKMHFDSTAPSISHIHTIRKRAVHTLAYYATLKWTPFNSNQSNQKNKTKQRQR